MLDIFEKLKKAMDLNFAKKSLVKEFKLSYAEADNKFKRACIAKQYLDFTTAQKKFLNYNVEIHYFESEDYPDREKCYMVYDGCNTFNVMMSRDYLRGNIDVKKFSNQIADAFIKINQTAYVNYIEDTKEEILSLPDDKVNVKLNEMYINIISSITEQDKTDKITIDDAEAIADYEELDENNK